jgi:acyl-CoA thioester hydrolase
MDKSQFKFHTQLRVRNYEVDWQGIVHNANYLHYFEVGRVEYLKHIGVKVDLNSIQHDSRVVLVRNEINYKSVVKFDELLNVYTRISRINNTSFIFEGLMEEDTSSKLVAENVAYHVWLHPITGEPVRVHDDFRKIIALFEGINLILTDSS